MEKICVGMPCNRQVKTKTVLSLLNLVANSPYEFHFVIAEDGYTISENRTYVVVQAIKTGCTHLLFVDDDMIFPPDTLERLLSHKKDIIGTVYHSRVLPLIQTAILDDGTRLTEFPKELLKCAFVGAGVMLIDLKVFEKIERPWFDTETFDNGMTKRGEDSWFCRQARKAGYEIWADPTLEIKHIGDYLF